jgi:hypothetical protein
MKMQCSVCPLWRTLNRNSCLSLLFALVALGQSALAQDGPQCSTNATLQVPASTGEWLLRKQVNEVNVFFFAAHKGKPIADLSQNDISVQDDNKSAAAILHFRAEQALPLRVGVAFRTHV